MWIEFENGELLNISQAILIRKEYDESKGKYIIRYYFGNSKDSLFSAFEDEKSRDEYMEEIRSKMDLG